MNPSPASHGLTSVCNAARHPTKNSNPIRMTFEIRNARRGSSRNRNGSTAGMLQANTTQHAARAPMMSSRETGFDDAGTRRTRSTMES